MPMFLIAPPKPVISCPEMGQADEDIRVHDRAADSLASFTYSPPATGTLMSSVPFRPSR